MADSLLLLVEDEPLIAMMLEDFLLALGHEVRASLAGRHDFGLAQTEYEQRVRTAWTMPPGWPPNSPASMLRSSQCS